MSKTCYIGPLKFKTKKEAQEYTRTIISELSLSDKINNKHKHFKFLSDLLRKHSEYEEKNKGFAYFFIKQDYGNSIQLNIMKIDGTFDSFSWRHCISPINSKNDLTRVMRESIYYEIKDYKFKHNFNICKLCGLNNPDAEFSEFHVDHIIPFQLIRDGFLKNRTDIPSNFKKENNRWIFNESDKLFEKEWQQYHSSFKNNFQILCEKCNLTKSNN